MGFVKGFDRSSAHLLVDILVYTTVEITVISSLKMFIEMASYITLSRAFFKRVGIAVSLETIVVIIMPVSTAKGS